MGAAPRSGTSRALPDRLTLVLDAAVVALAVAYLVLLGRQAAGAVFSSDECFHAYVSEWIAAHGRLPRDLPEFYSGLPYFYPPFFHLLGALAVKLAGAASLKYLNLVLTAVLISALYLIPVPGLRRDARRGAILLCMANVAITFYAVICYAETLATLMAVVVVLLMLRARALPGPGRAVLLGVALGVAILSKQSAPVLAALLLVVAAIDLVRARRALATTMLVALGIGLVVAAPFYVRNALLYGGPFYPPITNLDQIALDAMNTRMFSAPPAVFYQRAMGVMAPIPWLAAAALGWSLLRLRFNLATGVLAGCVAFVLLAPWVPRFEPRHLNPVSAIMAVMACLVIADALAARRWISLAAQAALIVWAMAAVSRLTGAREWADPSPADLEVHQAVARMVPAGGTVLSRSTYDTFYYARRNATWPIPWGGTSGQIALFREQDPGRFLARLDQLRIGYLLVPRRPSGQVFTGANYPESFVSCVATLVDRGFLKVLWGSADQVLVGRSEPAASAPE